VDPAGQVVEELLHQAAEELVAGREVEPAAVVDREGERRGPGGR
jgi:hypothetical protein